MFRWSSFDGRIEGALKGDETTVKTNMYLLFKKMYTLFCDQCLKYSLLPLV
jgi:hypothetical protein